MRWIVLGASALLICLGNAKAQPPPPPPPPSYTPIPPPRYEVVPPVPGPRVVWEPGHWHWNGFRYIWIGGHYIGRPPGRWVEGRWVWRGRWVWIPAHWG